MLSIRVRGEICLSKEGNVAKFAFEKGSMAIRVSGVAFRHAKMAWEKHLFMIKFNMKAMLI
ncbi:hypothetical protein DPMN_028831 [Dreissena polymorpha]|uniref:Uncharacterized protein n=1 Tax=Dreissena polymorpha TaxID=45954 RepID=A0A9D4LXZ8_DREPO|nr:hypothetical protein DPMN_028831 [Dreissena polymorpha]